MVIPNLIVFHETPKLEMTTNFLNVPKLLLIFAINTGKVYVSITPYIVCHVPHGSLHKRIGAFHELGRHRFEVHPSAIHL
jgi:hypothetical protein